MRNKNWTTIGIVVLIAGLLYYFFMQEGCMTCGKGSKSQVATSMDVDGGEMEEDVENPYDEGEEGTGQDEGLQDEGLDD